MRKRERAPDQPEWLAELSEVVDALPDLVATFDRDGGLLFINAAGIELLGHSQRRLTRLLISDLYDEPDAEHIIRGALQEALTKGSWSGYVELRHANGRRIATHQQWVAHAHHERKARRFTLIARPRLESRADGELRNRRESLAAMSLGFVHDLNNLLVPIGAYADLAAQVVADDHPAARYLEQLTSAAERGRHLTARLADLARAREPERSVVDMAELAGEVVRWLGIARPDLAIDVESRPETVTTVMGDPVRLHQVVMNLVRNSAEALSDRGGSIRVSIDHAMPPRSLSPCDAATYLRLSVHDDGRGIDEKVRAHIFEPFFSTRADGSGLGLNVSREIVLAHEGAITVEPGEPTGTKATIYLPLSREGGTI